MHTRIRVSNVTYDIVNIDILACKMYDVGYVKYIE